MLRNITVKNMALTGAVGDGYGVAGRRTCAHVVKSGDIDSKNQKKNEPPWVVFLISLVINTYVAPLTRGRCIVRADKQTRPN